MSEMTRAEQQGILADLKQFAIERSMAFRDGHIHRLNLTQSYELSDDPTIPKYGQSYEFPSAVGIHLGFMAIRHSAEGWKPIYEYELSLGISQEVDQVPPSLVSAVEAELRDMNSEDQDEDDEYYSSSSDVTTLRDIEEGELMECQELVIKINTDAPLKAKISYSHSLNYLGEPFVHVDSDEFHGLFVHRLKVPTAESLEGKDFMEVRDPIDHEAVLDDQIYYDLRFEELAECITSERPAHHTLEQSAQYIARILRSFRTGDLPF